MLLPAAAPAAAAADDEDAAEAAADCCMMGRRSRSVCTRFMTAAAAAGPLPRNASGTICCATDLNGARAPSGCFAKASALRLWCAGKDGCEDW